MYCIEVLVIPFLPQALCPNNKNIHEHMLLPQFSSFLNQEESVGVSIVWESRANILLACFCNVKVEDEMLKGFFIVLATHQTIKIVPHIEVSVFEHILCI